MLIWILLCWFSSYLCCVDFCCCCCCSGFVFNSCMDNYSVSYLLWIRTTIITEKSIVINLVQVSKQLPWGSSVSKLNFHSVNPELHSSLFITSGTQQEMFGVMCLAKKIEFTQWYLKIHCKSTLVQMRIEPGSSLSEANIKIRGEWIACCWKISVQLQSSSLLSHLVTTEELNTSQCLRVKSWPQWNQKDFFFWPQWGQAFTHNYSR